MGRRLNTRWIALGMLAALVAVAGCTAAPPRAKRPARATESNPYDFQKERKVPPLQPQDVTEEPDVEETPMVEESLDVEEAEAPPDTVLRPTVTPPASAPAVDTVDGFRVQVFASQSLDVSEAARRTAQARLGIPAHVEFVDGMYKVRVGDCRTRAEAETVLKACRAVFYKDAWVVETQVASPAPGGDG